MWWMYQESPKDTDGDFWRQGGKHCHMTEVTATYDAPEIKIQISIVWLRTSGLKKIIPPLEDLPAELRTQEQEPPPCFEPQENVCPYCPGPTAPALDQSKIVSTQAIVYGIKYVKRGISVAVKECSVWGNFVRFQEYVSGFHNFNNHMF